MNSPATSAETTSAGAVKGESKTKFSARMLINVGVYSALYIVVAFASGMIGMVSPAFSIVGYLVGVLINGAVIMLYMVKTPVFGDMTLLSVVLGLFFVASGHFWGTIPIAVIFGLLADLLVASGHYRSKWRNILAFAVFQMWMLGPFLPMFYDRAGYAEYVASSMGEEYSEAWMQLFSPTNLVILMGAIFVVALISAWIGSRIVERNLSRAGVL